MIVATFWTDAKYKALAGHCMASADRFGLSSIGREFPPVRKWSDALAYKTDVILSALDTQKEDVLYLDADTQIVVHPHILTEPGDFDVAINFLRPNLPHGCVIFWRNNTKARMLCKLWAKMRETYPSVQLDEVHFFYAYRELKCKVNVLHLPPAYAWMEEQMRSAYPTAEPVICHLGAGKGTDKAEVMAQVDLIR